MTPTHALQFLKLDSFVDIDSPLDAAAGSLEDVSPKIPDVRAALTTMAPNVSLSSRAHNILACVVIRLDVATNAGADRF